MSDPSALPAVVEFGTDADRIVERLEHVAAEIERSTDVRFIGDQRDRAAQAAKMLRAIGSARQAVVACLRFEMICLRRVAQLGASSLIESGELRNIAIALARAPKAEFDAVLDMVTERTNSVIGLARSIRMLADADREWTWALRTAERLEELPRRPFDDTTMSEGLRHAEAIVGAALVSGEFDMAHAAEELVDLLLGPAFQRDADALDMAAKIIRSACRSADTRSLSERGWPAFLTILAEHEGAERWIRVPFHLATVGQFRWVLEARTRQLNALADAHARWQALVDELAGRPDDAIAFPVPESQGAA